MYNNVASSDQHFSWWNENPRCRFAKTFFSINNNKLSRFVPTEYNGRENLLHRIQTFPSKGSGFFIESFQTKALLSIVDAPWYVRNSVIRDDLNMKTWREEIRVCAKSMDIDLSSKRRCKRSLGRRPRREMAKTSKALRPVKNLRVASSVSHWYLSFS